MKVKELIRQLKNFDEDMEVRIGMQQNYGTDFAMEIKDVEEHSVESFYGKDYMAIVITQGRQCGAVDYDGEHEDWI